MRSCLFLGVLAVLFTSFPTVSTAQIDTSRPVRGVNRPVAPTEDLSSMPAATPHSSGGITVSRDTKLGAGDRVSIVIEEDHDLLPLVTDVTVTGEVQLNGLGSVPVNGRSSAEAEALITSYLKQRYYHKATVKITVLTKSPGTVRRFKAQVTGKVSRPGPAYFDEANPMKLSEAVTSALPTTYAKLDKVRLTRSGSTSEYDVKAILKEGKTHLDVRLQDGDQIYVPEKGVTFHND